MELNEILKRVEKPARYIGGEYNGKVELGKDFNYCVCFPDVYEVGMSNLGIKIVKEAINSVEGASCDRCFAPWSDFGKELKQAGIPLYSLGLKKPLKEFDMIGFSLQYEMSYTTVLYMLDLAGIPLYAKDRGEEYPIIQGGGPCACNPEPIADFFDLFVIGDGEESMADLARLGKKHLKKSEFLRQASLLRGVYVPSLISSRKGNNGYEFSGSVKKAICKDLNNAVYPKKFTVGNIEAVFDRTVIECMRGCYRGCRFCQAGFIYRPVRNKNVDILVEQAKSIATTSGFDELSINSLSTGDYCHLKQLIDRLKTELGGVKLSLPSLRIDSFGEDTAKDVKRSLTFAPEAGTQRLRDVINKDVTEEEIDRCFNIAFNQGVTGIKLYFMMGLPTETDEDLCGIADIVNKIRSIYSADISKLKRLHISVSVSTFIPKPFTPFQWERQATKQEVEQKIKLLREKLKIRGVSFSWNDYELSFVEAVLARGDRSLSGAICKAYQNGAYLEGWSDNFSFEKWQNAFESTGIDPTEFSGEQDENKTLAWDFIDMCVDKRFLLAERKLSQKAKASGGCLSGCKGCGMQKEYDCEI